MPPLPLYPNQPAGANDINWSAAVTSRQAESLVPGTNMTYSQLQQLMSNLGNTVGAENTRQFDLNYEIQKRTIDNNYKVAMMNARTQQDQQRAQQAYNEAQVQLATERLQFDRETQAQNFGLNQAKLGYDLVGTAAQLRGPANHFQAAEYSRGVAGNPQTSTFLSALQNNNRMAGFGAQAGLPAPETLGSLTAKLNGDQSGGTGYGGDDANANYLAQVGNIAAKGAGKLGAGSLEQLTPTERALFESGLDEIGVDKNTFLSQYAQSRIGQGTSGLRAA